MFKRLNLSLLILGLTLGLLIPSLVSAFDHDDVEDDTLVPQIQNPALTVLENACVGVEHIYYYENDSVNTANRHFRSSVYSYAIELEDDFLADMDTLNLHCTDGEWTYEYCGFDKNTVQYGDVIFNDTTSRNGTSISYERLDWVAGQPDGLVWRYGQNDPNDVTLLPWLDPGEFKGEAIVFEPEAYDKAQSATTSSWTKAKYYWIDPAIYQNGSGSYSLADHTPIYPEEVDTDGDGDDDVGVDTDGDYIHWFGLNDRLRTNWQSCAAPALTCENLTWTSPDLFAGNQFDVNSLFSSPGPDLTVQAFDSTGTDVTSQLEFHYQAFDITGGNPSGAFIVGGINRGFDHTTTNPNVTYNSSDPGDILQVEVVGFENQCNAALEFPVCSVLDLKIPNGSSIITDGTETINVVTLEASTGQDWPFEVVYDSTDGNATFDGQIGPHVTTDLNADYVTQSTGLEEVSVEALHNQGGACFSNFFHETLITAPICEELEITQPTQTITLTQMLAGNVRIEWSETFDDGSIDVGPWTVTSSNPNGTFTDPNSGSVLGIGSVTVTQNEVLYNGDPGDEITVENNAFPAICNDSIDSEPDIDAPFCEDLNFEGPFLLDGTEIDLSNNDDLTLLYGERTSCFDFEVELSDPAFIGTLQAEGVDQFGNRTGTLEIDINGNTVLGNPANFFLNDGLSSYSGTVCWEDFVEEGQLTLEVLNENSCQADPFFPPLQDPPICIDLELEPDIVIFEADEDDAGVIDLTVQVEADQASWTGDLFIEATGSCELFYANGDDAELGGHLEIPLSGNSSTVFATAEGCDDNDTVEAFILNEPFCEDDFDVEQDDPDEAVCRELEMEPDSFTLDAQDEASGEVDITIDIEGENEDWEGTLVVESQGSCELFDEDGRTAGDELRIDVEGEDTRVEITCEGGEAGDVIEAFVLGETIACSDDFEFDQDDEPGVCHDISFNPDSIDVSPGEDETVRIDLDSWAEDQTILVQYYDCDGFIEYDGESYENELQIDNVDMDAFFNVTFTNICQDADIHVEVLGESCEDDLDVNVQEPGEFTQSIFTFNFASEKSPYTDDGIFFSHDEDRAFYTLQYDPSGYEESITFTDDMWAGTLNGTLGSGENSGGNVKLATSWDELTSAEGPGNNYGFNTILKFGFGEQHEIDSGDIATELDARYNANDFPTFIPYLKYDDGRQSTLIPECVSGMTSVCYDSAANPATNAMVVMHNVGTVDDGIAIRVRTVGVVDTGLDCANGQDGCLTEEFNNHAELEAFPGLVLESEASLVVLCSYLVTRNAGDVYLEVNLQGGSDISCIFVDETEAVSSDYRNSDALILLEGDSDTPENTTFQSNYSTETVGLCDNDEFSDNLIGNLSSYVCEIVTSVSNLWKSSSVEATTDSRITQSTRNALTNQGELTRFDSWENLESALKNQNNPNSGILYFDGQNTDSIDLGQIVVPEGAWTLIVENADLVIEQNITYALTENFNNLPSIAFIVVGGDIHIKNTARDLVGVYYTDQSFTGNARSAVNEPLEIKGSVYGHLQPLLNAAQYVGPPTQDGGGITIRYDNRILLNTPPGLSEYVDISTQEAVN